MEGLDEEEGLVKELQVMMIQNLESHVIEVSVDINHRGTEQELYHRGVVHVQEGRLGLAVEEFTRILEIDGENVRALFSRAAAFNGMGRLDRAIEDYTHALVLDKSVGRMSRAPHDWSVADSPKLRRVDHPSSPPPSSPSKLERDLPSHLIPVAKSKVRSTSLLGPVAMQTSSPKKGSISITHNSTSKSSTSRANSLTTAGKGISKYQTSPRVSKLLVYDHDSPIKRHTIPRAEVDTSIIKLKPPQCQTSLSDLACLHLANGIKYKNESPPNYQAAIDEFTIALRYNLSEFTILFNRGFVYDKMCMHHEAIMDYSLAIDLDASNAYVFYNRGISYDKIHCYDLAYCDFDTALSLHPDHVDFLHNRGYCAYKLQRFDAALDDYTRVIKLHPTHYKAFYNRGVCRKKLGRVMEAEEDFREASIIKATYHTDGDMTIM
jgi:tetratricopeptide (TPR) repeat protein